MEALEGGQQVGHEVYFKISYNSESGSFEKQRRSKKALEQVQFIHYMYEESTLGNTV